MAWTEQENLLLLLAASTCSWWLPPLIMTKFMWSYHRRALLGFQTAQPAPSITLPLCSLYSVWGVPLGCGCSWAPALMLLKCYLGGKHGLRSAFYEIQMLIRTHLNLFSITHSLLSWMSGSFLIIDGWVKSLACRIDFCLYEAVKGLW